MHGGSRSTGSPAGHPARVARPYLAPLTGRERRRTSGRGNTTGLREPETPPDIVRTRTAGWRLTDRTAQLTSLPCRKSEQGDRSGSARYRKAEPMRGGATTRCVHTEAGPRGRLVRIRPARVLTGAV